MALTITSIERGPQIPDETGEASSAALKIYSLILSQPPAERERAAVGCMRWAEVVCAPGRIRRLLARG